MQTSDPNSQISNPSQEHEQTQDFDNFLSSLPREKGCWSPYLYKYEGFWYEDWIFPGIVRREKHFHAQDSDCILVSVPKSGTTWLKALLFTLVNRKQYPLTQEHPLLMKNPHDLVPFLENASKVPDFSNLQNPRLLSSHSPLISIKKSLLDSKCKVVYICRNPKDNFTSLWHFSNKSNLDKSVENPTVDEAFDMFAKGINPYGPCWDHVLDYYKASKEQPDKIFFLKYEEMKEQPVLQLRRLAEFIGFPFSVEEEASGLMEEILSFCSFDNLKNMEVNKNGKFAFHQNKAFFRKGEIGDWKNLLTDEMADQLDSITEEKFQGSGLKF